MAWLPKLSNVISERSQDVIVGTDSSTPLADAAGLAPVAKTLTWQSEIDRSNPILAILLYVKVNVDIAASAMTPDGIGAIVKNISFERQGVGAENSNAKRGKLSVWNTVGVAALERQWNIGKLDRLTYNCLKNYAVRTAFTLCYKLDLADDQVVDPLRSITACPVHLDQANPILKVDFAAQSDMEASGGTAFKLKHLVAEVHIIRADMPPEVTAKIIADGGFLEHDTISRDVSFSSSTKQRVEIESPGEYSSIILTTFSSATARGAITASGDPVYDLQVQNKSRREFTALGLQAENSSSIIETTDHLFTHTSHLDFVGDQLGNAENNFGALLNANVEQLNGQKTILAFRGGGANTRIRWTGRRYLTPIGARRFAFANV